MAEAVGLAASVVGLAAFGAKLSLTLYEYGDTIVHARKQIDGIANEVTLCSTVLRHMGAVLEGEKAIYSPALVVTTTRIIQECKVLFREIRSKVKHRKRQSGKGIHRIKWLFDKPRAKELMAELEGLKSTLMLMVQTVSLATKAPKNDDRSDQDVDGIKKELELLKSLIIANHNMILNLQEVEMEAALGIDPVPPPSVRLPVDQSYARGAGYHDAQFPPDSAQQPIYEIRASTAREVAARGAPRLHPSYEGAAKDDRTHHVSHPGKPGAERNKEVDGVNAVSWRDGPVVILNSGRDTDHTNDMNEPGLTQPFVSSDHQGTVNSDPGLSSLPASPLALYENSRTPVHVPSTRPDRHSTSCLLIEEVPSGYPSGYYVRPSVKGLITEGGYQSNDRPFSNAKQDTTNTIKLLLDKWTVVGSSYVTALIDEVPQLSEDEEAEQPGQRSRRGKGRRRASAKTNGDHTTGYSDSESSENSDMNSGYATTSDEYDDDGGHPRRSNDGPGGNYSQRPSHHRRESYERVPYAQRYEMPRYGNADYGNYDPQPHHMRSAPEVSQPWGHPRSAGNDELRLLESRLDHQERYFNLQVEKLKVEMKLEGRENREAEAAEREARRQTLVKEAEFTKESARVAAEKAAAEERYKSEPILEAWKPAAACTSPADEHDGYDVIDLLAKKDRGGVIWSRGNAARLSMFVGLTKFLTVQFIPPSYLQAGEELDKYTIIGKEWVRREVLELFEHPFVEKEAAFYEISRPLTFPQVKSLVSTSFQLRKDSYAHTARSLMAVRASQFFSTPKDDDEVLHSSTSSSTSSSTASPPLPDELHDVHPKKSQPPPDTSARQDKGKERIRHAAGLGREQGRERRKKRTSSTTSRSRKLF